MKLLKMLPVFALTLTSLNASALVPRIASSGEESTKPVRYGKITAIVTKSVLTKNPDGTYDSVQEEICRSSHPISVYEFVQNEPISIGNGEAINCKTKLKSGDATVFIPSAIFVARGAPDDFNPGQKVDLKSFFATVGVVSKDGTDIKFGSNVTAMTEDLDARSMRLTGFVESFKDSEGNEFRSQETINFLALVEDAQ